jgi:hypothetical protein
MTEQELVAKLTAMAKSQKSTWKRNAGGVILVEENFKLRQPPSSSGGSNPITQ